MKLFILFTLLATTCQAQTDTSLLSVRYKFSHIKDTTKPEEVYTENMQVFVGATISMYKSADKEMFDSINNAALMQQYKELEGSMNLNINMRDRKIASSSVFYKNELTKTLSVLQNLGQKYLIESELPTIKWVITAETKNIQNYTCQKATTIFKGRNFVAWFCADLPYSNGPWKLGGLPGLILEAYDPNGTVKFMFTAVTRVSQPIEVPKRVAKISPAEFNKLLDMRENDPEAFFKTALSSSNTSLEGTITSIKVDTSKRKKLVINNPLELSKD
ncbi:MAG: GLPGLI family protein [Flavobacterium sp.]|nr:GLPGLI family protein [Flavobacterium sp.]